MKTGFEKLFIDGFIDYTNFYDVDDIGYIEETEEIVIIKQDKIISLFANEDCTHENVFNRRCRRKICDNMLVNNY